MSFRTRLSLFFLLIVVVPMLGVGILVAELEGQSQTEQATARLSTGLDTATSVYGEELDRARVAARDASLDRELSRALRSGGAGRVRAAARDLLASENLAAIAVMGPEGEPVARLGGRDPVAESRVTMRGGGRVLGSVQVSTVTAREYTAEVARLTGLEVALMQEGVPVAATARLGSDQLAPDEEGKVELPSGEYRLATVPLGGAEPGVSVAMFARLEPAGPLGSRPVVAAALVAFFALALGFVILLVRRLQGQIAAMLGAAQRIGAGDFSREVPVKGDDEMAGLAREMNRMSNQLSSQMEQLRAQRVEVERSITRIGEAFAYGLDRDALLEVVAETGLAGCGAESCRIALGAAGHAGAGAHLEGVAAHAVEEAELQALREGSEGEATEGDRHAVSRPLVSVHERHRRLGVMTIVRRDSPFNDRERELLRYLAGQAAVSVENLELHGMLAEQAATDGLTGLSNKRRFMELIEKEVARAARFDHPISLLMIDIDDFKRVNDTHGHLQGDEVLRRVAGILHAESRGVDEPARYGGEEFVLALPETGAGGALDVAERVRSRVEATAIPLDDGAGTIAVTVSVGIATLPDSARDVHGLIASADAAMYAAKQAGKNRCITARPGVPTAPAAPQGPAPGRRT